MQSSTLELTAGKLDRNNSRVKRQSNAHVAIVQANARQEASALWLPEPVPPKVRVTLHPVSLGPLADLRARLATPAARKTTGAATQEERAARHAEALAALVREDYSP